MKKQISILIMLITTFISYAQVGIGNTDPQSTLDITASSVISPSPTDGLLVPRVNTFPSTDPDPAQDGMLLFITGAAGSTPKKGFYYWDADDSAWIALIKPNTIFVNATLTGDTNITQNANGPNPNYAGYNKIIFDSETTSTAAYNEIDGVFTAPEAGTYNITAYFNSTFDAVEDTEDIVGIAIYKNGSVMLKNQYRGTEFTSYYRLINVTLYLNVNDTIEIFIGFPETYLEFNALDASATGLTITRLN